MAVLTLNKTTKSILVPYLIGVIYGSNNQLAYHMGIEPTLDTSNMINRENIYEQWENSTEKLSINSATIPEGFPLLTDTQIPDSIKDKIVYVQVYNPVQLYGLETIQKSKLEKIVPAAKNDQGYENSYLMLYDTGNMILANDVSGFIAKMFNNNDYSIEKVHKEVLNIIEMTFPA